MPNGLSLALIFAMGVVLLSPAEAHAGIALSPHLAAQARPLSALHLAKSVIDKSCLRMCDQWGDHGRLKWVTRCKGDPGYPKPQNKAY